MDIQDCLRERFLVKVKPAADLIQKELGEASYDIERAEKAFSDEDWKWAIVKAYYCMFHAARAILFKLGLREKKHFAVGVVLDDLNKKGKLEIRYVNDFSAALSSREDAGYHYVYNKEAAEHGIEIAENFLNRMKRLLDALNKLK